jgi:hypothetical protein
MLNEMHEAKGANIFEFLFNYIQIVQEAYLILVYANCYSLKRWKFEIRKNL